MNPNILVTNTQDTHTADILPARLVFVATLPDGSQALGLVAHNEGQTPFLVRVPADTLTPPPTATTTA